MLPVGFEPTVSAGERPKTYALDSAVTGTGIIPPMPHTNSFYHRRCIVQSVDSALNNTLENEFSISFMLSNRSGSTINVLQPKNTSLPELYELYKYEERALGKKFLREMAPVFGFEMWTNKFGFRHALIPWIRVSLNSY